MRREIRTREQSEKFIKRYENDFDIEFNDKQRDLIKKYKSREYVSEHCYIEKQCKKIDTFYLRGDDRFGKIPNIYEAKQYYS